jgi:hypothetical protein
MTCDKCWRIDHKEIHDVLITVAKEAGAMITGAKPVAEGVGSKKNCKFSFRVKCFSSMIIAY